MTSPYLYRERRSRALFTAADIRVLTSVQSLPVNYLASTMRGDLNADDYMTSTYQGVRDDGLVYDVGMHLGEDSAYYLALGFKVVAFEANPELVALSRRRFAEEIANGRLTIVAGAIATGSAMQVPFYKNPKTVWGTASRDWARRNEQLGQPSTVIWVPRVEFGDCIRRFGVPYYAKVDVEGADELVLAELSRAGSMPSFVSIESEKSSVHKLDAQINTLTSAGYNRFQIVQQAFIPGSRVAVRRLDGGIMTYRFERHSSGQFGDQLPNSWVSAAEIKRQYLAVFRMYRLLGDQSRIRRWARLLIRPVEQLTRVALPGWHDLHAGR